VTDFSARTLRLRSAPVHGTLFVPATAEPSAAVLLIGGSGGSEPSYVAEPLASAGIAALSVAYFARPGLPGQLRDISLEYFFSALEVLRDQLPPDTPLAVLGMSRGSEGGDAHLYPVRRSRPRGTGDSARKHRGGQLAAGRPRVAPGRPAPAVCESR
jgi:hypothetical protein